MKAHVLLGFLLMVCLLGVSGELIVLPVVTDEAPGLHDSVWVTDAQIIKINPSDNVVATMRWICLPEGGFEFEPDAAPQVQLDTRRISQLWGSELLARTQEATHGAVAFEVEGGTVIATSRVVDVSRGEAVDTHYAFGQGQLIPAFKEPLRGPSYIPWLGGCLNRPCSTDSPQVWSFLRNNIGLVNPNPEPLEISFVVIPFGRTSGPAREYSDPDPEEFSKVVPAFGWLQFPWLANHTYGNDSFGDPYVPTAGFVISLRPRQNQPYYAYASVVFTPDPNSGVSAFSDPMFVPAKPGYFAPVTEVTPAP